MTIAAEHSASSATPSNSVAATPWRLLGAACRAACEADSPSTALERTLETALEATGAERAFLVVTDPVRGRVAPRVEASVCRRQDGEGAPSLTVLSRSLAGRRPLLWADAAGDPGLAEGASVRSLGLRLVLSAPVAVAPPRRAALVLDSRGGRGPKHAELRDLLQAFAAVVGLAWRGRPAEAGRPPRAADGPRLAAPELIGSSRPFLSLLALARRSAPWPLPVLVTGESGTGKEGIARLLHLEGPRREGPFVAVNCAAVPESLLESELFGAVRGAYTGLDRDRRGLFRVASGGTLLLDEVGDMSPAMQARLLRVLQEACVRPVGGETEEPVDVRIVAATHHDLRRRVAAGEFRADLFYRLAVVELHAPALRERRDDIPLLVRHLGAKLARSTGTLEPSWTAEALDHLKRHDWPGNVRELETAVARAWLRAGGGEILPRHLDLEAGCPRVPTAPGSDLESRMIERALREAGGVVAQAAARIGWSRQKLSRRMAALGVPRPMADPLPEAR